MDAYAAYNALADPARAGGPVTLAYCWSPRPAPVLRDRPGRQRPDRRGGARAHRRALSASSARSAARRPSSAAPCARTRARPLVDELRAWLEAQLAKVPGGSRIAEAIRYALKHWAGLTVFLDDGRVEIDSNVVERSIRPIALNRKNALFAGSDQGGVHWGVIASLIETCKLNAVDPQAYLADVLTRLVNRHPASQIDQLMPWAYARPTVA